MHWYLLHQLYRRWRWSRIWSRRWHRWWFRRWTRLRRWTRWTRRIWTWWHWWIQCFWLLYLWLCMTLMNFIDSAIDLTGIGRCWPWRWSWWRTYWWRPRRWSYRRWHRRRTDRWRIGMHSDLFYHNVLILTGFWRHRIWCRPWRSRFRGHRK